MYQLFIGIDVSKDWIDAACWSQGQPQALDRFANSVEGFEQFVLAVKQQQSVPQSRWLICFENTGHYSKLLLLWLFEQGIPCVEENALQIARSKGITRGKADMVDACVICAYAKRHGDKLTPTIPDHQAIATLKRLLAQRRLFVRQRAALITARRANSPEITQIQQQELKAMTDEVIAMLSKQIDSLELMIDQLISAQQELQTNCTLLQSIAGIGPVVAWHLLACTKNFSSFQSARQFACYAGIAPFPNQSGSSIHGKDRVHYLANRHMKALLSNSVLAAIKTDPEIQNYFTRKRAEGKEFGTVANAIKNKIVSRACAVVKRQTPYVSIMQYAS